MNDHQQAEDSIDHKFIWVSRWVGWCISQSGLDTTNASGAALRMHRDFCSDAHASIEVASVIELSEASGQVAAGLFMTEG